MNRSDLIIELVTEWEKSYPDIDFLIHTIPFPWLKLKHSALSQLCVDFQEEHVRVWDSIVTLQYISYVDPEFLEKLHAQISTWRWKVRL